MIDVQRSKVNGEIEAPPSKSYSIRYIILSSLIEGKNCIRGIKPSSDIEDAIALLKASGRTITGKGDIQINNDSSIAFSKLELKGSATVHRIAVALAATFPGRKRIVTGENLKTRPIDPLLLSLSKQGVHFTKEKNTIAVAGMLKDTDFEIIGNVSSQYITALLFTAVALKREVHIKLTTDPVSKTYLEMTRKSLKNVGVDVRIEGNNIYATPYRIKPFDITVPGDFALGSFFAVMASRNGLSVRIGNLDPATSGDSYIVDIIKSSGAISRVGHNMWEVEKNGALEPVNIGLADYPDLLPPVAALVSESKGVSEITGVSHLRYKESDRITETVRLLQLFGVYSKFDGRSLVIRGGKGHRFRYNSPEDHRMAMCSVSLASSYGGSVEGEHCISKCYPDFLNDFGNLGGKMLAT